MSIRKPPDSLEFINDAILNAGALIERIHSSDYAGNTFNPCKGNPGRFSPINDKHQNCVPSLYAGETFEVAVFETIFHKISARNRHKRVRKQDISKTAHVKLKVGRNLRLGSLREPDLKAWGIGRNQLISSSPKLYPQTAKWAQSIHHQFEHLDGLEWTSNQCDPYTAYLFFGDRVTSNDLEIVYSRDGKSSISLFKDVRSIGMRSGITIAN